MAVNPVLTDQPGGLVLIGLGAFCGSYEIMSLSIIPLPEENCKGGIRAGFSESPPDFIKS